MIIYQEGEFDNDEELEADEKASKEFEELKKVVREIGKLHSKYRENLKLNRKVSKEGLRVVCEDLSEG